MNGAIDLGDGLTSIDIWQGIHTNARSWDNASFGVSPLHDRTLIDGTDLSVLKALSNFPADKWLAMCEAVGMTVYGAVALSWCEGAELSQVWDDWKASGFPLKPLPEYERPARFINPALLPKTNSLEALLEFESLNELAFCAILSALQEPLEFDMPVETMKKAPVQISAFLKSHMLRKTSRTEEENDLIAHWSEKIKGSEWDVWEGS